ncbi:hypothetical protein EYC80_004027 [Monilinia laxa]|uniref:Uncharacterized protein n=1 Tax=Monilinia laxa TaxID=61186 RepID=A0A5N6KLU1_MONLA|nr:hypothetical protein EYC80_004027 [Monilinia laxa]
MKKGVWARLIVNGLFSLMISWRFTMVYNSLNPFYFSLDLHSLDSWYNIKSVCFRNRMTNYLKYLARNARDPLQIHPRISNRHPLSHAFSCGIFLPDFISTH